MIANDNRFIIGRFAAGEGRFKRRSELFGEWQPEIPYEGYFRFSWRCSKRAAPWIGAILFLIIACGWRI